MGRYTFIPHNPNYPDLFKAEKEKIESVLGPNALIEHVGSTAVPGLGGKGVIDIYIVVPKEKMAEASNLLQEELGYTFKPDAGVFGERLFHNRKILDGFGNLLREFHAHVSYPESDDFKKAIAFRNCLRMYPEDAKRYEDIKKVASEEGSTKDEYMAMKSGVIKEILQKALGNPGPLNP